MSAETLRGSPIACAPAAASASEAAEDVGTSRVTARRYLEHLAARGVVDAALPLRRPAGPEVGYVWTGAEPG